MSLVFDGAMQMIQSTASGDRNVRSLLADNVSRVLTLHRISRLFGEIIQFRPDFNVVNRLFPAFRRDFG